MQLMNKKTFIHFKGFLNHPMLHQQRATILSSNLKKWAYKQVQPQYAES